MAVIKLFRVVQKHFEALGFYASSQPNQRCEFNRKNVFYLCSATGVFIPVAGFFFYEANSAHEYSSSFYVLTTVAAMTVHFPVLFYKMGSFLKLIEAYEEFIEQRTEHKPTTTIIYSELNEKIELVSKWINFIYVKATAAGIILPLFVLSVVNYFIFDLGDQSFLLRSPMLLPFNWKTPLGYLIVMATEGAYSYSALFVFAPLVSFFIGSAWLEAAFIKDVRNDLTELNDSITASNGNKKKELKERLCKIIRFYSDAKQFMDEFSKIYEFTITTVFLWSLLCVASSLLLFESELSAGNLNALEMIFGLMLTSASFLYIFLFCQFGEMVNTQFELFDEELYQCNWYAFPNEIQKLLPIIMSGTQRPATYQGFGNTECTRETFKKTIKCGFSYFTSLRSIGA